MRDLVLVLVASILPGVVEARDFTLRLYGDVNATWDDDTEEVAVAPGPLDLFARADLGDQISLLSETVFLPEVHVARLFVDYRPWQPVRLRFGRYHTPLGYYTTNFPHGGSVFRLATVRPRLVRVEAGEAIVPNHLQGVAAATELPVSGFGVLEANLAVGDKAGQPGYAWAARISARPDALIEGLDTGVSGFAQRIDPALGPHAAHGGGAPMEDLEMHDGAEMAGEGEMSGDHAHTNAAEEIWETVVVGHLSYELYPVEFVGELWYIRHAESVSGGHVHTVLGAFAQLGWSFDIYTPYARYEQFSRDPEDLAFTTRGAEVEYREVLGGVRAALHPMSTVKLEYANELERAAQRVTLQATFGF